MLGPLDFLYCPSRDAAADLAFWTERLGATPVFAIERFETRVACVEPASGGPAVLFAEHLEGERPVLLHRVDDLAASVADLRSRGVEVGEQLPTAHEPRPVGGAPELEGRRAFHEGAIEIEERRALRGSVAVAVVGFVSPHSPRR